MQPQGNARNLKIPLLEIYVEFGSSIENTALVFAQPVRWEIKVLCIQLTSLIYDKQQIFEKQNIAVATSLELEMFAVRAVIIRRRNGTTSVVLVAANTKQSNHPHKNALAKWTLAISD